jgi:hypothetical protein
MADEPKPTAADLRIKFLEDQKKARMDYYKQIKEDLGSFAKGVLDVKSNTNAAVNSSPKPTAAKVESTTTVTPMSPVRLEAPRGRQRGGVGSENVGQGTTTQSAGSFYNVYVSADDGHTYLQGGTVTGGDGTDTIADIKVIDSGSGPVSAVGNHLYVEATGNGVVEDGVLLPGWDLTSASTGTAASVPSDTLPTASSSSGKKCYVDLGVFTSDDFLPAAAGSIRISFCPGSYTVSRS